MSEPQIWNAADLADHFVYLDMLRLAGDTNMFGAAPVLAEAHGIPRTMARSVLSMWMATYDADTPPGQRAAAAIEKAAE